MSNKLILQLLIASAFIGTHLNAITETVYNLSNGIAYVTNANLMNKKLLNMNDSISQPTVSTIYISSGNIYNNNKLSLQGYAYLQISSGPKTNSIQVNEYDSSGKLSNTYKLTDNNSLYIFSSSTTVSGLQVQNTSTPPANATAPAKNATAQAKSFTITNNTTENISLMPCDSNNKWSNPTTTILPSTTVTINPTSNYYCTQATQTHPFILQLDLTSTSSTSMTLSQYDYPNNLKSKYNWLPVPAGYQKITLSPATGKLQTAGLPTSEMNGWSFSYSA